MCEARVLEIIGKRPVGGVGTVMLNYQIFGGWIGSRNHLIKK